MKSPSVTFVHIPKTAGTSLVTALRKVVPEELTALYYPPDGVSNFRDLRSKKLVSGHFSFNMIQGICSSSAVVSFVREPLARIASQFRLDVDIFGVPPSSLPQHSPEQKILACVEDWKFWYYDNCMVRMIGGFHDLVPFGTIDESHLQVALCNLEHFAFVGVFEQYQADLEVLGRLLGMNLELLTENASPRSIAYEPFVSPLAQSLIAWDFELYDRVRKLRKDGQLARVLFSA